MTPGLRLHNVLCTTLRPILNHSKHITSGSGHISAALKGQRLKAASEYWWICSPPIEARKSAICNAYSTSGGKLVKNKQIISSKRTLPSSKEVSRLNSITLNCNFITSAGGLTCLTTCRATLPVCPTSCYVCTLTGTSEAEIKYVPRNDLFYRPESPQAQQSAGKCYKLGHQHTNGYSYHMCSSDLCKLKHKVPHEKLSRDEFGINYILKKCDSDISLPYWALDLYVHDAESGKMTSEHPLFLKVTGPPPVKVAELGFKEYEETKAEVAPAVSADVTANQSILNSHRDTQHGIVDKNFKESCDNKNHRSEVSDHTSPLQDEFMVPSEDQEISASQSGTPSVFHSPPLDGAEVSRSGPDTTDSKSANDDHDNKDIALVDNNIADTAKLEREADHEDIDTETPDVLVKPVDDISTQTDSILTESVEMLNDTSECAAPSDHLETDVGLMDVEEQDETCPSKSGREEMKSDLKRGSSRRKRKNILPVALLEQVTAVARGDPGSAESVAETASHSVQVVADQSGLSKRQKHNDTDAEDRCDTAVSSPDIHTSLLSDNGEPGAADSSTNSNDPNGLLLPGLISSEEDGGLEDGICDISPLFSATFDREYKKFEKRNKKKSKKKGWKKRGEDGDESPEKKKRPTHFVAVQITNQEVHDAIGRVQESVKEKEPLLSSAMIPLATLHLTLMVMELKDELDLAKAKSAIDACKEKLLHLLPEIVSLEIKGMGNFGNSVVFANVHPGDGLDNLSSIAEMVQKCMAEEDVVPYDKSGFKPHLTVMKLSRARGLWKKGIKKISSDLYQDHMDKDFGTQCVESLQLCAMAKAASGYYPVLHEVALSDAMEKKLESRKGQIDDLVAVAEFVKEIKWNFYKGSYDTEVKGQSPNTQENKEKKIDPKGN